MSLTTTLTGMGGMQLVPTFGCDCATCQRAYLQMQYRRRPCSGVVRFNSMTTLLDIGIPYLMDDQPAGGFQQFLLTHYHVDHMQGLFPLHRSVGTTIPMYDPPDEQGCDDLFEHPGILGFSHTVAPLVVFDLQGLQVTSLPPSHPKLTLGYLLEIACSHVAWLSGTAGFPDKTLRFLHNSQLQVIITDYNHTPRTEPPRNHCDLSTIIALSNVIHCPRVILTYISHQFDLWMMEHPLPVEFETRYDGVEAVLE